MGSKGSRNIHVMSAGKGLSKTFQVAIKKFPVDEVIIVTNLESGKSSDKRQPIVEAVQFVEETCSRLDWPCRVVDVGGGSLDEVRDRVMDAYLRSPNDNYYYNITGGTKIMSLGLFMVSLWVDGICYYVDEVSSDVMLLGTPRMHVDAVLDNPNYELILNRLADKSGLRMKELFEWMAYHHVMVREGDKSARRSLSRGTLSKWVTRLAEWKLVEVANEDGNNKEKRVNITPDGRFAIKFIKASQGRMVKR